MALKSRPCLKQLPTCRRVTSYQSYTCLRCQICRLSTARRSAPSRPLNLSSPSRRNASNDNFEGSFADKVRKKIWGTQAPPGQRNPYEKETPEEQEERALDEEEKELIKREQEEIQQLGATDTEATEEIIQDVDEIDDVEAEDQVPLEYAPATTWKGLRSIHDIKMAERIIKSEYHGFIPKTQMLSPNDIQFAVKRALVEIWVLKEAGESLKTLEAVRKLSESAIIRLTDASTCKKRDSKRYELTTNDKALKSDILDSLRQTGTDHAEDTSFDNSRQDSSHLLRVDERYLMGQKRRRPHGSSMGSMPDEHDYPNKPALFTEAIDTSPNDVEQTTLEQSPQENLVHPQQINVIQKPPPAVNQSWRKLPLDNPTVKFGVVKRVMQLTGIRISDPYLQRIETAGDLVQSILTPPKPAKLAPVLLETQNLTSLPNVHLHSGRWALKEKEREIGREKLIVKELARRGLPYDMKQVRQVKRH